MTQPLNPTLLVLGTPSLGDDNDSARGLGVGIALSIALWTMAVVIWQFWR